MRASLPRCESYCFSFAAADEAVWVAEVLRGRPLEKEGEELVAGDEGDLPNRASNLLFPDTPPFMPVLRELDLALVVREEEVDADEARGTALALTLPAEGALRERVLRLAGD